ncbi:hypothetical protein CD29_13595 [Ureibacillus manganicus DSM 26584]|uniref:Uncharacterized protein n=1 Tax=Ureibacillus manganicus DSM 26584 TaxID=1384049 RepID=A0A0A3ISW2_9BACL|nr:hypothetical protein CD29_13595 [Ureibacillus manganicus DSM 26584]
MREWWNKKKSKTRKNKKGNNHYTFFDFILDALFWLPELLFLPFRIVFWLLRGLGRLIWDLF